MHQTFDAFFQFHKATVVGNIGDLAEQAGVFRITPCDFNPGIIAHLLEAERYTHTFTIKLQNLNVNFIANLNNFARMFDPLPRHISNVQQAVYATQINKGTVVGEVLDHTLDDRAFLHAFQNGFAL